MRSGAWLAANSSPSSPERATATVVALLLEGVLDAPRDGVLVFDDEDRGGHRRDRTPVRPARHGPTAARARPENEPRGTRVPGFRSSRRRSAAQVVPIASTLRYAMPAARPTLAAAPRERDRRRSSHLRKAGQLPGRRLRPRPRVDQRHRRRPRVRAAPPHDRARTRSSTSRSTGRRPTPVLVHGVQVHPVTRRPLHVDLFLVRMTEELTVDVPLVATGSRRPSNVHGGTLLHPSSTSASGRCPTTCPQSIEYDIASLATSTTSIPSRELTIPGGRDAAHRPRRDRGQGPAAARRGGEPGRRRGRGGRGSRRSRGRRPRARPRKVLARREPNRNRSPSRPKARSAPASLPGRSRSRGRSGVGAPARRASASQSGHESVGHLLALPPRQAIEELLLRRTRPGTRRSSRDRTGG